MSLPAAIAQCDLRRESAAFMLHNQWLAPQKTTQAVCSPAAPQPVWRLSPRVVAEMSPTLHPQVEGRPWRRVMGPQA